jgi:tRNA1(Val) A37 N6-methylase TrmN6
MEIVKNLRDVSKEQALNSYNELKAIQCADIDLTLSRIGTKALDYFFFQHRIKAKTKRHISFYEILSMPDKVAHLNKLVEQYKKTKIKGLTRTELLRHQYGVFQLYYGTINQFRPMVAKWLYCTLKPQTGILDFSAGWGGRCLAAMSLGIPYIGVDSNTKMKSAYHNMIKTYDPKAPVKMIFQPSETVNFSKFQYDLIFTSPPYFKLEEYEKMPDYSSKQDFLDRFFIPVVLAAWAGLKPKGHMALNMPAEMYDAVKSFLPRLKKSYVLPLINRHPGAAARRVTLNSRSKGHKELIYVWQKSARQTRKQKQPKKSATTRKHRPQ